jgi:hypothetical protein
MAPNKFAIVPGINNLAAAIKCENPAIVRSLLEKGHDPNIRKNFIICL